MRRGLITVLVVAILSATVPLSAELPRNADDVSSPTWLMTLFSFLHVSRDTRLETSIGRQPSAYPESPNRGDWVSEVPDFSSGTTQSNEGDDNSLPDLDPNG